MDVWVLPPRHPSFEGGGVSPTEPCGDPGTAVAAEPRCSAAAPKGAGTRRGGSRPRPGPGVAWVNSPTGTGVPQRAGVRREAEVRETTFLVIKRGFKGNQIAHCAQTQVPEEHGVRWVTNTPYLQ